VKGEEIMVYAGYVEKGMVVVDDPVALPDGTRVKVEIVPLVIEDSSGERLETLYDQLAPLVGAAKGLPPDLARNHDHYLHGQPRK
jgi:hypothetical protein